MYAISGFHKLTEQDSFTDGCIGNGSDCFIDYAIKDAAIDGLKAKIADFIGCQVDDLALDACDEAGRIDAGRTENANGDEASEREIEAWRKGELVLYYAVYSCDVVECRPVSLS